MRRMVPTLLTVMLFGHGVAFAQSSPDFSNVDDVLLGRRLMLPVQDLVLGLNGAGEAQSAGNFILQTENGEVTPFFSRATYTPGGAPLALASGRLFDLPNDVIVTLARVAGAPTSAVLNLRDPLGDRTLNIPLGPPICAPSTAGCAPDLLAIGDLTGDGYAEVVIGYSTGSLQVASAADVTDFTQGLVFGGAHQVSNGIGAQALAVLDVQGDGGGEIAAVTLPSFTVYTVVAGGPNRLDLEIGGSTPFNPQGGSPLVFGLVPGQFDADATDGELVVAYNGPTEIQLSLVDIASNLAPTVGGPQGQGHPGPSFALAAGRLDWFGDSDQVALLMGNGDPATNPAASQLTVAVVTASAGVLTQASTLTFGNTTCGNQFPLTATAVALGDFDFDLQNPSSTPPNLEIALLFPCLAAGVNEYELQLYTVDPGNSFALAQSLATIGTLTVTDPSSAFLISSDTQGRSLLLGPPQKVALTQHSQPRIVMGAPPMHIDYVQNPVNDPNSFDVVNMTAYPAIDQSSIHAMSSSFSVASSSQVQNQSTHSTSYSYSVTTGTGVNAGFKVPDAGSLGIAATSTVQTTHDNLVANKFGTYSGFSFKIDAISGFGDVVWFDSRRFNIWTYRVLGHLACPADDASCDTKLPLHMTFSGPDQIVSHPHTPGTMVEWYQPFHEVGNILSYPQGLLQLQEALAAPTSFQEFFSESFVTGSTDASETLNWAQGDNSSKSTGYVKTHSQTQSESASASGTLLGFTSGETVSFSENSSSSFTTLNTVVETMASTNGFSVSVPGFNLGEEYSYPLSGYIVGDAPDPAVLQTELLDELKGEVDLTINGTLRLAFTAQPDQAAGNWWQNGTAPYLSAADVALNHPFRWSLLTESSGPLSSVYCFNILDRDDVQQTGGYEIKGLFVLPEGAATGPQLTVADEGQVLQLAARVYNYSRLDMAQASPPVAQVKVQFYAQEWNTSTQQFEGDAFLIDTASVGPIPGNNSNNGGLNAALATTLFDTGTCPLPGGCGGKSLKFWLVVWMEDANGNLVADYQDHGLKKAPTAPFTALGQVDLEPISNNVGYYDQDIYICPQGTVCSVPPGGLAADALTLAEVSVAASEVAAFQPVDVRVRLVSGPQPIGAALVTFYDGDPGNGGKVFEVEHVPFVRANATHLVKVRYQPPTSGPHDIVAVVQAANGTLTGRARLQVATTPSGAPTCQNPLSAATRLDGIIEGIGAGGRGVQLRLTATVPLEGPLDLGATTVTIDRLAHELGGAKELMRGADGTPPGSLVLRARGSGRSRQVVYETGSRERPNVRLTLRHLRDNLVQLSLQVRNATMPELPALCSGTPLTTSLMHRVSIDDGMNPPRRLAIESRWECVRDQQGALRSLRVLAEDQ